MSTARGRDRHARGSARPQHRRLTALAVIILCVIAGGTRSVRTAVAEQPSVAPPDPTLELRPDAGPGGAEVEVHGEGWDPDSTDIVATWGFLDDVMESDLRIDDSGTLRPHLRVLARAA